MALPTSMSTAAKAFPVRYGVVLALYPGDPTLPIDLQSATGAASTNWRSLILQPANARELVHEFESAYSTRTIYFRARHVAKGYAAGGFTAIVSGRPTLLTERAVSPAHEGRRRTDTLYRTDGVVKESGLQSDGTLNLALVKGFQTGEANGGKKSGASWVDGAAVTFPAGNYESAPDVKLYFGSGAVALEPTAAKWTSTSLFSASVRQYVELTAVSVTAAGFTPRARLVQRTTGLTARTAQFGTSNALTAINQATSASIINAPSYNDQYTLHHNWTMTRLSTKKSGLARLTVAYEANTTGAYVERATQVLVGDFAGSGSTAGSTHVQQTITAGAGSTGDKVRVKLKSFTVTGSLTTSNVTYRVHGFDGVGDPTAGVTYQTATTATIYAPICPTTVDKVTWTAVSVAAAGT